MKSSFGKCVVRHDGMFDGNYTKYGDVINFCYVILYVQEQVQIITFEVVILWNRDKIILLGKRNKIATSPYWLRLFIRIYQEFTCIHPVRYV